MVAKFEFFCSVWPNEWTQHSWKCGFKKKVFQNRPKNDWFRVHFVSFLAEIQGLPKMVHFGPDACMKSIWFAQKSTPHMPISGVTFFDFENRAKIGYFRAKTIWAIFWLSTHNRYIPDFFPFSSQTISFFANVRPELDSQCPNWVE